MIASANKTPDPLDAARDLLEVVPAIMYTLRAGMRRHGDWHHAHYRVLKAAAHGPVSTGGLAEAFEVSAPSMTRTVDVLVERGLVERRADEEDRRRVLVCLTDAGEEKLRDLHQATIEQLAGFLEGATPEELSSLSAGMLVLREAIDRTHSHPSNKLKEGQE